MSRARINLSFDMEDPDEFRTYTILKSLADRKKATTYITRLIIARESPPSADNFMRGDKKWKNPFSQGADMSGRDLDEFISAEPDEKISKPEPKPMPKQEPVKEPEPAPKPKEEEPEEVVDMSAINTLFDIYGD